MYGGISKKTLLFERYRAYYYQNRRLKVVYDALFKKNVQEGLPD